MCILVIFFLLIFSCQFHKVKLLSPKHFSKLLRCFFSYDSILSEDIAIILMKFNEKYFCN